MPKIDKDADVELKLDGAAGALQGTTTQPQRRGLFEYPGTSVFAVVELTSKAYTGHADGEDKDPQVKIRVTLAEVAQDDEQAQMVAEVMRAMMRHRKMNGTLDELGPGSRDVAAAVSEALGNMPTEREFEVYQERKRSTRRDRVEHEG
ncbi:hypothetical protein EES45_23120 [Streptomyces sp. ADI97-07]|uniref:hypothetical protein n=1 Tax=Streptomyces sp. ADI97-07 TaxID=1522762 RepID=UPI000F5564F6|nr:hypothetical protein [Streptomyces sp. ADI97-07]RPK76386.1 hypothetical protein EES45_23120 [Streptomyces sp. ADI97-07]